MTCLFNNFYYRKYFSKKAFGLVGNNSTHGLIFNALNSSLSGDWERVAKVEHNSVEFQKTEQKTQNVRYIYE